MPEMMQDIPIKDEDEIRDIADDLVEKGAIPDAEGYIRARTYDLGLGVEVIPGSQAWDDRVGWYEKVRLPSGKIVEHLIPYSHEHQAWEDPGLWVGGSPDEGPSGGPKLGGVEPLGGYPPVGGIMAPPGETPLTEATGGMWDWLRERWYSIFGEPEAELISEKVLIPGQLTISTFSDGTVEFHDYKNLMDVDEVTAMEMYADYQVERPTAEAGMPTVARWEVVEDQGERFYVGYDAQGNIIETQYLGSSPTPGMTEWQKEQIDLRERERKDAIQRDRRRREQELELAELSRLPPEISEYQEAMLELQRQEFEWRQQQDGQLSPWQEEQLRLSREQLEWQREQFGELSAWQQEQMGLEQQQFGELSAWQQAQMGLEEQELAWRREQHGTLSAWQEEQLGLAREELALEQRNYEAQLAAQPHSWLEYHKVTGETPLVQPHMLPLMAHEYPELRVGDPIPGWQPLSPQGQLGATQQPPYQETEMWAGQPTTQNFGTPQYGGQPPFRNISQRPATPEFGTPASGFEATGEIDPRTGNLIYTRIDPRQGRQALSREDSYKMILGGGGYTAGVRNMQYGGWVTKPTIAKLGEKEPELVTPLSQMSLRGRLGAGPQKMRPPTTPSPSYTQAPTGRVTETYTRGGVEAIVSGSKRTFPGETYEQWLARIGGPEYPYYRSLYEQDKYGRGFMGGAEATEYEKWSGMGSAIQARQRGQPLVSTPTMGGGISQPSPISGSQGEPTQPQYGGAGVPTQMPALTRPSRQYQGRMGPTAFGQYAGYEQMRTGIRPEELEWRLWNMAPPGGRHRGLTYMR